LLFIDGEWLQGEKRTNHVFAHRVGLSLCLDPHRAMNIEPSMSPKEKTVAPFGAEELLGYLPFHKEIGALV